MAVECNSYEHIQINIEPNTNSGHCHHTLRNFNSMTGVNSAG